MFGVWPQAATVEIVHGRLRTKVNATVTANTIGKVLGLVDSMVKVQVEAMLPDAGGKTKVIEATFKSATLEVQKDRRLFRCDVCSHHTLHTASYAQLSYGFGARRFARTHRLQDEPVTSGASSSATALPTPKGLEYLASGGGKTLEVGCSCNLNFDLKFFAPYVA